MYKTGKVFEYIISGKDGYFILILKFNFAGGIRYEGE